MPDPEIEAKLFGRVQFPAGGEPRGAAHYVPSPAGPARRHSRRYISRDLKTEAARLIEVVSWASPLLLLPGVALLIVSTSTRFESVHQEIHQQLEDGTREAKHCAAHAARRARILVIAMVALYGSVASLAISGVFGALSPWTPEVSQLLTP